MNDLKYRVKISTTVDTNLHKAFEALARETRIPMSKLYDEAIADLLKKHGKPVPIPKRDEA